MKQYRLRLFHKDRTVWTEWRELDIPFGDKDILTVQFNEPLTMAEAMLLFKNYEVK